MKSPAFIYHTELKKHNLYIQLRYPDQCRLLVSCMLQSINNHESVGVQYVWILNTPKGKTSKLMTENCFPLSRKVYFPKEKRRFIKLWLNNKASLVYIRALYFQIFIKRNKTYNTSTYYWHILLTWTILVHMWRYLDTLY